MTFAARVSCNISVLALAAAGALPAGALAQQAPVAGVPGQEVGTVAAVNRDMAGTPPGAARRDLNLGLGVVRNERVETSEIGSGQLMFLDQTTLTVSPSADIVLDEYVYDPAAGTSDLALSVTKGALRFIGGRITKTGPAIVRTPTATVGIRGGMSVIDIDDQGNTEIIHIAGEFTSVMQCGDADGDGIDDACGADEARSSVFLSRPSATARATAAGGVEYTGLASTDKLAGIYGRLEGQGQGGIDRVPGEATVQGGSTQVASVNSGVQGGETNRPVSTSGEQPSSGTSQAENFTEPTTVAQNNDPSVGGVPGDAEPPGETPTGTLVPDGGAAFSQTIGFQPFTTVVAGSLIGRSATETIRVPVPDSPAGLLAVHPDGAEFTPKAVSLYPNTGLFEFTAENTFSSTLGGLEGEFGAVGVGLADFTNEFVFVPFADADGFELGAAMFGTPTPGQGKFFVDDPNIAGAQTVDTYHNEFGLDLARSFLVNSVDGRRPEPEQLFLVGKSGEARFQEGAEPIGRAVSGAFVIDEEFGRNERLALFVEPLRSGSTTRAPEMTISGAGFVTLNNGNFFFAEPAYGTFEDSDGHTLFGPEGNYFTLGSVHRDNDGSLDTTDFGTDLVTIDSFAPDGAISDASAYRASLFTRDPALGEVIASPLPLAGAPGFTGPENTLDGGFAAGVAVCSSSNCGFDPGDEVAEPLGVYPLFSTAGPFGTSVSFDENSAGLSFNFLMSDDNESNIGNAGNDGEPDQFLFNVGANVSFGETDQWGAYLDDRRFAAVGTGTQVIAGNAQQGTVGMGSSGLVGTPSGLFPAGVDSTPEFLRWGYWSATYQVTDGTTGEVRTDLVPAGQFVVGNLADPADVPFTGSATYSGFAVATAAELATGTTRTIGGSFGMNYDFGQQSGRVDINLPEFSVPSVSIGVTGADGDISYGGLIEGPGLEAEVRGGFFSGGGNPVAATAGNFVIDDRANNSAALGIYGGDQTSFTGGGVAFAE